MIWNNKLEHFGTKKYLYHYLFFWGKVRAYLCDRVVQADWDTDMNWGSNTLAFINNEHNTARMNNCDSDGSSFFSQKVTLNASNESINKVGIHKKS